MKDALLSFACISRCGLTTYSPTASTQLDNLRPLHLLQENQRTNRLGNLNGGKER